MLKRFLFICTAVVLFASNAHAQVFTVGPKVGVSSTTIKLEDNINEYESGDAQYSYHAGVFARITIAGFFVQPELYFNSVNGSAISTTGGNNYEFDRNKVDIPVLFGWKLGPLRLNAGPVASFNTNTEIDTDDPANQYKSAIFAYQAGVGLDVSKLTFDLRYEGNLSGQGTLGANDGEFKVNQLLFSLGFKIL